jgi:tetratricopeptide (TPR) repeat protein
MRLGQTEQAIADFSRAISLVPANPAALTGRGRAHLGAWRPAAAIRDFSRAVTHDARFSAAYRSRAEARLIMESYEPAIEDFSRAIAFEARNADLYVLRGTAYLQAGNAASAVKDFATAIDLGPRNSWAYVARGFAYAKAEAFDDALADFARAIELDPRSAKPFAYRAWTYRRQQQPELALKDVERALRLDANSPEAYWARGEIHEAQGRPTQAVPDLKKALSLDPLLKDAARALERLGVALSREEVEVANAGLEGWRVSTKGRQYVATNDQFPKLSVDIEMIGKGQPKILEWEVKKTPFAGIGVLYFHAGIVEGPRGAEDVEQLAVLDLQSNTVVSVEMQRRGTRIAQLTWDEGKLTVASADGTKDEFQLRQGKPKEVAAVPKKAVEQPKPWARSGKPKTLFELLFGN